MSLSNCQPNEGSDAKPLEISRRWVGVKAARLGLELCAPGKRGSGKPRSLMHVFPSKLFRSSVTRLNFGLETSWGRDGVPAFLPAFDFHGAPSVLANCESRMKRAAGRQGQGCHGTRL